ncbi:MAG TPA: chromosomal replication initiator protein DnaA [Bdellovibrionota bacterium]|nr:chromosomal replication initiator protein DnaA [Bdellovibrionota bacterium]
MKTIWDQALSQLQSELPPHAFNTWLRPLRLRDSEAAHIVVEVPNAFYRDRLRFDYGPILRNKLREFSQLESLDVEFVVVPGTQETSLIQDLGRTQEAIRKRPKENGEGDRPNARYTFGSFVVGNSNQFAHAAAQAVAGAPGETYNPLFIYGGVGLGKTHLLCAVGNEILSSRPRARVLYRTAERFMNELINAIRYEKTPEFRSRYRESCDVLLIDDTQFFAGKERTQEEFFHTFNALHEANKQIVLTSDKYPKEIPDLDERLRSRFEWGLFADIQPPDVETRVAILKKKAEAEKLDLPDDAALYLATQIKSNVRVLEGALIRLAAFSSISGRPITMELTQEVFSTLAPENAAITVDAIQKRVADFFNLNISDLRSSRRHKVVAFPRQVAMYLGRKLTSSSYPELGTKFGGKDHTTVMHAVSKIERLLGEDSPLRTTIASIEKSLQT